MLQYLLIARFTPVSELPNGGLSNFDKILTTYIVPQIDKYMLEMFRRVIFPETKPLPDAPQQHKGFVKLKLLDFQRTLIGDLRSI